jgi:hypothetical protein
MKKKLIGILFCMIMITTSALPVVAIRGKERQDSEKMTNGVTGDERVNLTIIVYSGFWSFIHSQILRKNESVVVTGVTVLGNQITGEEDTPESLTDENGVCTVKLHPGEEYIIGVSNYRGLIYAINYVVFTIKITSDTTMSVVLHGIIFPGLAISK